MGAASGMSIACDFRFFYEEDDLFERFLGDSPVSPLRGRTGTLDAGL